MSHECEGPRPDEVSMYPGTDVFNQPCWWVGWDLEHYEILFCPWCGEKLPLPEPADV